MRSIRGDFASRDGCMSPPVTSSEAESDIVVLSQNRAERLELDLLDAANPKFFHPCLHARTKP